MDDAAYLAQFATLDARTGPDYVSWALPGGGELGAYWSPYAGTWEVLELTPCTDDVDGEAQWLDQRAERADAEAIAYVLAVLRLVEMGVES